jgi:hypothetical protein
VIAPTSRPSSSTSSARDVRMVDPLRPVQDAVIPLSQVLTVDVSEPLEQVVARLGPDRRR